MSLIEACFMECSLLVFVMKPLMEPNVGTLLYKNLCPMMTPQNNIV